jgi:hypothetical protein
MNDNARNSLKRLQFLTSNYNLLMGYPMAMVGVMYIVLGASVMIWGRPVVHMIYGWLFVVSLALLVTAIIVAGRYHRRKFGTVKTPMNGRRARVIAAFVILYMVLIRFAGADFKNLKVALEPTVLNGGLMLILLGLLPGFPWRHYAAVGLLLSAAAFLPAVHLATVEQFWHGWSFMAPGLAFLLCGTIDRVIFLRSLPSQHGQESHA